MFKEIILGTYVRSFILAVVFVLLTSFILSPYLLRSAPDVRHGWPFPYPNSFDSYVHMSDMPQFERKVFFGSKTTSIVPSWVHNSVEGSSKTALFLYFLLNLATWYVGILLCDLLYRKYIKDVGLRVCGLSIIYVALVFLGYFLFSLATSWGDLDYVASFSYFITQLLFLAFSVFISLAIAKLPAPTTTFLVSAIIFPIPAILFIVVLIISGSLGFDVLGLILFGYIIVVHIAPFVSYFIKKRSSTLSEQ
jgi:hypothetical protein